MELLPVEHVVRESIAARLRGAGEFELSGRLSRCGEPVGWRECCHCGTAQPVFYRCNIRWCPDCAWRISAVRAAKVSAWAKTCGQPKHVTLTARNTTTLHREDVREMSAAFSRLRRMRDFRWTRGCRTMEITNEGRGWHLHIHALVDVRWIDPAKLAISWARQIGQDDAAIVCVKDARDSDYLAEVAKYAVKPIQMAGWPAQDAAMFVRALQGTRTFSTFGDLRGFQTPPRPCECPACARIGGSWKFWPGESLVWAEAAAQRETDAHESFYPRHAPGTKRRG